MHVENWIGLLVRKGIINGELFSFKVRKKEVFVLKRYDLFHPPSNFALIYLLLVLF